MKYFDNYMDFKEKLEELFHRPIDLVENQSIKNPIFRNVVDQQKQLIYERKFVVLKEEVNQLIK